MNPFKQKIAHENTALPRLSGRRFIRKLSRPRYETQLNLIERKEE